ncbi:hypothetical protein E4U15_001943 [Claviceps sp. LM218 group G6]|nr:hypothetical protein E4U15_001943 [Claviceps sp. LM218 group G6]
MFDSMDRGLDEIIADKHDNGPRHRRVGRDGRDSRRRHQTEYPRDGVKKSTRDEPRHLDSEWVHDRYDEHDSRRAPAPRRRRHSPSSEKMGSKLRVENIHYDLTEEDLDELFSRIGPVSKLNLRYDRAGRSEGTAYVTYDRKEHAEEAVRQFDGANANGQPIKLKLLPSRNPFDTAVMPGRPLAERVSNPGGRARSASPHNRLRGDDASRRGIDRYTPSGQSKNSAPRRRGGREEGRRPGARREREGNGQDGARGGGRSNPRVKKTQEELDAEMEDYFGGDSNEAVPVIQAFSDGAAPPPPDTEDIDMIE